MYITEVYSWLQEGVQGVSKNCFRSHAIFLLRSKSQAQNKLKMGKQKINVLCVVDWCAYIYMRLHVSLKNQIATVPMKKWTAADRWCEGKAL